MVRKLELEDRDNADVVQHCIVEWIKQDSSKGQCPMCRQSRSLQSIRRKYTDWWQNSNGRIILQWEDLCESHDDRGCTYCMRLQFMDCFHWLGRGVLVHDTTRTSNTLRSQWAYWSTEIMDMIPLLLQAQIIYLCLNNSDSTRKYVTFIFGHWGTETEQLLKVKGTRLRRYQHSGPFIKRRLRFFVDAESNSW